MIRIGRTRAVGLIKHIALEPHTYPFVIDDFSPSPEDYDPPVSEEFIWLVAYRENRVIGLFLFLPLNAINFDIHASVLPWARGTKWSRVAGAAALTWMWQNTRCKRITAGCPSFNPRALGWVKALGFKEFCVNEKSFQKANQLHDLIMLGISKPGEKE
jgi:RimJ/RimL family protein N-acetyltransferase